MKLKLIRDVIEPDLTLGRLFIDDEEFCYTCEDEVRDVKIPGKTAIPYGTYRVILTYSNRFKKVLPLLLNVPNYEGVRIHSGNTVADTEGCILVGLNRTDTGVSDSRTAMNDILPILHKAHESNEIVEIEIA